MRSSPRVPRGESAEPSTGRSAPPRWQAPLEGLLLAVTLFTVFCAGFHSLISEDFWFHLRAGSEIARGHLPRVDTFSYPSAGHPYVDLHWLFQLTLWSVHRLGGEPLAIWFQCLLLVGTYALLYRLTRRDAPLPLAAGLTALGAILASERFLVRPELFSFFFLVLFQWLVRRHREGSKRAFWLLPVAQVFWVNSEGLFVLGPIVLLAHLADHPRDRRLWQSLLLCLAASLINPYFVNGALHPLILFSRVNRSLPIYSQTIGEFLSPFAADALHPSVVLLPFYLGLLGLALLTRGRWPKRSELILLAAFLYLALSARRNLGLLPLVTTPILAGALAEGISRRRVRARWARLPDAVRKGLGVTALGSLLFGFLAYDLALGTDRIYAWSETNRRFGTGAAPAAFPRATARFLAENRVPGPIFSMMGAGSHLTYAYPQERVFIDGRLEVHSAEHYARYLAILRGGEAWERAEREYEFNCVMLTYTESWDLTLGRMRDPDYAPVQLDDAALVFLRRNGKNSDLIRRHELTPDRLSASFPSLTPAEVDAGFAPPPIPRRSLLQRIFTRESVPWSQLNLGQLFLTLSRFDLAAGQFLEAARQAPGLAPPRILLASTLNQMAKPAVAYQVLEGTESLCRSSTLKKRLYVVRGDVLLALNRPKEAIQAYTLCLENASTPNDRGAVLVNRGLARYRAGDPTSAVEDIREGLRIHPSFVAGYSILGAIEEARGNSPAARQAYETFLRLGGRSDEVTAALARLRGP